MKRLGNIFDQVYTTENLYLADVKARKSKRNQYGVRLFDTNKEANLLQLQEILKKKTYKTSQYKVSTIFEKKERIVYKLPYFPDRITHHAIMNLLEPVWVSTFIADTYSCIKGRGIHAAANNLKKALKDVEGTNYCLKLDIKKFYPSIDHDILKSIIRRKIKDNNLLWLLDEIIDSAPGVPIGNYLSQYFANLYLTYFDHWIKENKGVKYYFRYADDIVILADNKPYLHQVLADIRQYLQSELKLSIKANYQVFPVEDRGIDFVGYVFFHTHVLLRKGIKVNFARAMAKSNNPASLPSYWGWAKHCNSKHLLKKITMKKFSEMGIEPSTSHFIGDKIKMTKILNKQIIVHGFKVGESKFKDKNDKCLSLQIELNGEKHVVFSGSGILIDMIKQVPADGFPFETTIVQEDQRLEFK